MKSSASFGVKAADSLTRRWVSPLLFVGVVALSFTLLFRATSPSAPFPVSHLRAELSSAPPIADEEQSAAFAEPTVVASDPQPQETQEMRLERVLKAAATADNTVIMTSLNAFWSTPGSVLDVFLESFRIGDGTSALLDHLVIVAVDDKAYERCLAVHRHCFDFKVQGVDFSGEKVFNTPEYLDMMWARLDFLRLVLEKGYNFVFSDVDVMWFRNPLPFFYPDGDFQISCDNFLGDPTNMKNWPNNGFNYARSNYRTIEFFKYWYASRARFPNVHEQNVLNIIKFEQHVRDMGVQIRFLSTERFGGICEPSRDFNKVCTMHANCCIGLKKKIDDLRAMLDDWRKFMSSPSDQRISRHFAWSVPQSCRLPPGFFSKKEKKPQL
ncbi:uncharacterized protein At4g15970-like isoform X1 [Zingiber officinale]|uniref:Nucleotide-diphospho-sugar transferase domain-containing protein n=1 Tax=Zingiber officinale TaxID=94328 RepID=A0A8J5HH93_ZINOF|nr:uncharacterized protein At4g15970-like isoform X1 [Zingiber officinale]KAG6524427.1 hypothetical protein ZIOFF_014336 [Zingiber officinale]